MEATRRPRVKVCCIRSPEEAWIAVRAGASALGLVSEMPSGPGVIDEGTIARIAKGAPPPVATFLLTSRQAASAIAAQQRRTGASTVQICDRLTAGSYADLRREMPGIALVQVVHVEGESALAEAAAAAAEVDAILLDSGRPSAAVKELGGTGRRHDWSVSRRVRASVPVPMFLAGGLNPENVAEAVAAVGPFALDVCSGVRTDGELDPEKLERFFAALPG
jgi:phosphoribosylanthranilate isomerase